MKGAVIIKYLRKKLSSDSLGERVIFAVLLFLTLFFGVMIISYFFLPEGFLKNKNPLQNWETSKSIFICTLQIFFYNMLSVMGIVVASLFGRKKESEVNYLSVGYVVFFVQIFINGVVVGTWSFSMGGAAVPLFGRIIRTFDLAHRAGLWEMTGQLFITCAVARIATITTSGKNTMTRKIKDIHLSKPEIALLAIGLVLMLIGAFVESNAINAL